MGGGWRVARRRTTTGWLRRILCMSRLFLQMTTRETSGHLHGRVRKRIQTDRYQQGQAPESHCHLTANNAFLSMANTVQVTSSIRTTSITWDLSMCPHSQVDNRNFCFQFLEIQKKRTGPTMKTKQTWITTPQKINRSRQKMMQTTGSPKGPPRALSEVSVACLYPLIVDMFDHTWHQDANSFFGLIIFQEVR